MSLENGVCGDAQLIERTAELLGREGSRSSTVTISSDNVPSYFLLRQHTL